MDEIKKSLDEQISKDLEVIAKQKPGDESRKEAIDQLRELHRMRIEEEELERESKARDEDREIQTKLNVAGLVVPNTILLGSLITGFIIETNGVISGKTFERILRFIKPGRLIKFLK